MIVGLLETTRPLAVNRVKSDFLSICTKNMFPRYIFEGFRHWENGVNEYNLTESNVCRNLHLSTNTYNSFTVQTTNAVKQYGLIAVANESKS